MSNVVLDLEALLAKLSPEQLQSVKTDVMAATGDALWIPSPGPQQEAYLSEADELFYGGSAGCGKSALLIGLSLTRHKRSLILRRTNKEAQGFVDEIVALLGSRDGYNGQEGTWRLPGGRIIDTGGCQLEEDRQKFKGRPHDLIGFDELSDFSESQYVFLIGWNRSTEPGQRCRVVGAGNPPTRPEGLWVVKRWGAWLDPSHPNPAQPGELRWYTTGEDGKEIEVDGRGPHPVGGEMIEARSRTFIPGKLSDNPDLARTNYAATLAALPEELRAAYRDGRFDAALEDGAYQTIPTAWIREAQARWKPQAPLGVPMCAIAVDVAQGGKDETVLAARHDGWYAPLFRVPGAQTPDGKAVAGLVVSRRRDNAKVIIDLGGGWGGDAYGHLKENNIDTVGYMGVKPSDRRTVDRQLKFFNKRTEAYWRFREALDPSQPGGSTIMLPQDAVMVADLTAPTFVVEAGGIKVEAKDKVCARLGRSTDSGDAVVMCWLDGLKVSNVQGGFQGNRRAPIKVVMRKP